MVREEKTEEAPAPETTPAPETAPEPETAEPAQTFAWEPTPTPVPAPAPAPAKRFFDFAAIFSKPLFLAICILMTVMVAMQFVTERKSILNLLFMIAGWVTYGKAKGKDVPLGGMKFMKGVIVARYVLNYVFGGCVIACGVGLISYYFVAGVTIEDLLNRGIYIANQISSVPVLGDVAVAIVQAIVDAYNSAVSAVYSVAGELEISLFESIFVTSTAMGIALFGALVLLFNVLYTRRVKLFAGSLCENAEDPNVEILKARAVKNWFMVLGILTAIGALFMFGNILGIISVGVSAAVLICGSVFVKNNFVEEK